MRGRGVKAIVGNWGLGAPALREAGDDHDAWAFDEARRMLDYAGKHGHLIGLHSYYKPRPWYGVQGDRNAWGRVGGFWMLRQKWDVDCWRSLGITVPHFAITESGRDDVPGTPGPGKGYHDERVTSDGDYADFMWWFCRHMTAIPECALVVDYGFGTIEHRWWTFDLSIDPIMLLDRMAPLMTQLPKGTQSMPTPQPEPGTRRFYEKVAWATEEAARILKREGMQKAHDYIVAQYVADATRKRDALPPR
jgi:hypothetical protein